MNTFINNKVALIAMATLGVALFAGGVHADDVQVGAPTVKVRYADLNLAAAAGAKVLYQRIEIAAKQVCGDMETRQLDVAAATRACRDQAIKNSVRAVNQAQLTRTAYAHGYQIETNINMAAR